MECVNKGKFRSKRLDKTIFPFMIERSCITYFIHFSKISKERFKIARASFHPFLKFYAIHGFFNTRVFLVIT